MGTWGYKTFENDGAADWLYDLEEAAEGDFLLTALRPVIRAKGKADLDDALECLAAAEVIAGARYEPPRDLPRIARSWVKRAGFAPKDADLKLAIRAVEKIGKHSELADTWRSESKLAPWQKELRKLSARLAASMRAPMPVRKIKPKTVRETLADLIFAVAADPAGPRRAELQKKLEKLSNPDMVVAGTINGKRSNRLTPLHWVASRGLIPEAKLLIARGAKVNVAVSFMSPPIGFAMEHDHVEMVALLLEAGADPQTALFDAIRDKRFEIMKLIVSRGIDLKAKTEGGWTAIHWAARCGSMDALKLLLDHGCDVNCTNDWGDTPLHQAAEEAQFEAARYLVEHGAKLSPVNSEQQTPLALAVEAKAKRIVQFLRQRGASGT